MRFTDFLHDLTDAQRMLLDTVHRFAQEEIAVLAEAIDQTNVFPQHLWQRMGSMGTLGVTVSEQFGGLGLGYLDHLLIMALISEASPSVGLSYGAHANLCVSQIDRHGTDAQKQKYLPSLISGDNVGALAMSETSAGSDVTALKLSAKENENGDFVLNGHKMWITNGPDAQVVITYAKTTKPDGEEAITAFIIDDHCSGWHPAQKLDKLGMRGSNTSELVFDQCVVPRDQILGNVHEGVAVLMRGLDYERIVLCGGPLGIMQQCMNVVLPYLAERKQFGKSIGQFQLMQGKIADLYTVFGASCTWACHVARLADAARMQRFDAASAIMYVSENATKMALETIQCMGGNGYTNDYPAGRLLRDAKLYEIGAGTNEIRRMLIGRELLRPYMGS